MRFKSTWHTRTAKFSRIYTHGGEKACMVAGRVGRRLRSRVDHKFGSTPFAYMKGRL